MLFESFEPIADGEPGDLVRRVVEIHSRIVTRSIASATTPCA
jgi:hypothetical protein